MLNNLLIYIIACYGLSNIIVFSHGPFNCFEHLRNMMDKLPSNLGELTQCMICFPSWVGIGMSLINIFICPDYYITPFYSAIHNTDLWFIIIPLDCVFTSGSTWLIHTLQETLESITAKNNGE